MDLDTIINLVDEKGIKLVRFLYCDTSSIIRGKVSNLEGLKGRLQSGIGLVKGMMAMNLMDEMQTDTGYGAVGEVRLLPDLSTFSILPYAPGAALLLCDMVELDRTPWKLCPRSLLKRQLEEYKQLGIRFEAAFEPEFLLGRLENDQLVPIDKSNCFSTDGMNRAHDFISEFIDSLAVQGLCTEQYYPELGHGQHELSVQYAPALEAADNHIIYRETLRGTATKHGLAASLAPKPSANAAGNGCHLHISAWDSDTNSNMFYADDGLSSFGKCFVAGLLRHLPALVAITCASANSYRRLQPRSWSSAYTCWGYENREAAVRVPSLYWDRELESANLEIKCVDSSSNPYLALAAIIACGMDGVKRKMNPPEPLSVDPSTLLGAEAAEKKVERLPVSLRDACKKLFMNQTLKDSIGEEMINVFLKVKSSEEQLFSKMSQEDEMRAHLLKF